MLGIKQLQRRFEAVLDIRWMNDWAYDRFGMENKMLIIYITSDELFFISFALSFCLCSYPSNLVELLKISW